MQSVQLRIDQRSCPSEMINRSRTIPSLEIEHRQHPVRRGVTGSNLEQPLQERNCRLAASSIVNLSRSSKCSRVRWRNLQGPLKCTQRILILSALREGNSLQRPKLCVIWFPPKSSPAQFNCLSCFAGLKRRAHRLGQLLLRPDRGEKQHRKQRSAKYFTQCHAINPDTPEQAAAPA